MKVIASKTNKPTAQPAAHRPVAEVFQEFGEACAALYEHPETPASVKELLNSLDSDIFNLHAEADYSDLVTISFRVTTAIRLESIRQGKAKAKRHRLTLAE